MGETVWVKQPMDLNFTCVPLEKLKLQSSEFGHIVIKVAVIDSKLDSESGQDLEKNLPATLLALRTITHESTGFSPAELVHGKNLRTAGVLLYEHWVKPQEADSIVADYVFELINLMRSQELAIEKMTEVRAKRNVWFDTNAIGRKFQIGDLVLVLETSKPNKMSVQCHWRHRKPTFRNELHCSDGE
ncbi:hypothetical protein AVEN_180407-1 [Araneus ventricosus]|uniref:Uncharacterized protein n=1 Tax=Araneus ventricosus TaxID=182803 RepID=A0A4Y2JH49_ARAVE|nr:hypothetical protein AVEN_180407-1 [Araneus ventricosus]